METPRGGGKIYLLDREKLPLYAAQLAHYQAQLCDAVTYLWAVAKAMDRGDITKSLPLQFNSSALKERATQLGVEICHGCMGMQGGGGYTESALRRRWHDAGVAPIYEGHNLLQRDHQSRDFVEHVNANYRK